MEFCPFIFKILLTLPLTELNIYWLFLKQNPPTVLLYITRKLICVCRKYLKGELLSVVEEHKDGHLEGGHLEDVLPGVRARHLSTTHAHL